MTHTDAEVVADGDRWTLILIRELRQPPEQVWPALVDPARLDRWAPFSAGRSLADTGATTLTTVDGDERSTLPAVVHRAEPPHLLEYSWGEDLLRWELAPSGTGTRLTLRHTLADRDMDAMVAAGWHLCGDVLQRLLDGEPVTAIRGRDAMNHGWPELRDRYAATFARP
ncbi:hypothetical protein Acy02nite_06730 [Actinoplanes cyaneus]|uniref:Activator of Hsp90 ATPase homologue 1/2-like C-terminal domain-containing protein n=1 Tax=Actinoplanes cyaneus TaxID=52696 RepID=A0A919IE89_9ACTN|nr:SRPBCC domain-containing protein [Actinoplanes cyaneus]MCW2135843.1 putative conserved protein YndB, AHSA1/START domain [Actinoplanes cyaneus]GID62792.1 hypothetical protein Acy02nite_06730 [Actinoplanes cyaneus]